MAIHFGNIDVVPIVVVIIVVVTIVVTIIVVTTMVVFTVIESIIPYCCCLFLSVLSLFVRLPSQLV
jgi:hypothetical protein